NTIPLARVFNPLSVILQFVVTPFSATSLKYPLRGVRMISTFAVKFVVPSEPPAFLFDRSCLRVSRIARQHRCKRYQEQNMIAVSAYSHHSPVPGVSWLVSDVHHNFVFNFLILLVLCSPLAATSVARRLRL